MSELERELRNYIIENYFLDQERAFRNADSFMELGIIDSTGVLELVSYLQQRYAVQIAEDELVPENLDSIDNLTRFLRKKLGMKDKTSTAAVELEALRGEASMRERE